MARQQIINSVVGGYNSSNIAKVCKSTSVNMYFEKQEAGEASSPAILRSIQGTSVALNMPEKCCRGMYRVSRGRNGYPVLYAVYGTHCYLITEYNGSLNASEIGTVSGAITEPVSMCETGGYGDAHPHLIVADGAQLFAVDTTMTAAEQRADWKAIALPQKAGSTTEPIHPTHVAYLYGYLAVLDGGSDAFYLSVQYPFEEQIFGDDIFGLEDHEVPAVENEDGTVIPAYTIKGNVKGNAVYSEWSADTTRGLWKCGSFLYTFGDRSFQCFSYHDDVNYPFQSPDSAAMAIGIRAPRSAAMVGNQIFWLGASDIGQNGIFVAEGTSVKRVSTSDIEREIDSFAAPEDAVAQVWQEAKHVFYAITFRMANRTLVYDVTEGIWSIRSSFDTSMPDNEGHWRPQFATLAYNKLMFGTLNDNKLIYLDTNKWTEYDGLPIVRKRRSGAIIDGWTPFYCDSVKLISNCGQVSDGLTPRVSLRFSWDGMTWLDQEIGTAGQTGRYDWNLQWWQLGMGNILMLEFSSSDPWDFSIVSAKIQGSPCNIF